jgi:DNA-binding LacI/PurR family transcriptional regulator/DNA-binding transcriptional regulator YhcF (GntR family)
VGIVRSTYTSEVKRRMAEGLSGRLARQFLEKIESGQWPAGQRVPTTRVLAAEYGVSVNTVQTAFRVLEASDLVERRPRLGGFVKAKPGRTSVARETQVGARPPGAGAAAAATTVAVVVEQPEYADPAVAAVSPDTWAYRIISGGSGELAEGTERVHVAMFTYDLDDPQAVPRLLEQIDRAGATLAGVLCFLRPQLMPLLAGLDRRDIPWVTTNPPGEHAPHNFVAQDAQAAGRLIGRLMARERTPRVMILSDRMAIGKSTPQLYFGFMQGWIERGGRTRAVDYVGWASNHEADGYAQTRAYLEEYGPPGGVVAGGDLLAIGAMRAFREAGLAVGRDVKVIGTTGLGLAAYTNPPMTVSEVPMESMGRHAARMLLEMARGGTRRMLGRYIPARLIVRESWPIEAEMLDEERRQLTREASP